MKEHTGMKKSVLLTAVLIGVLVVSAIAVAAQLVCITPTGRKYHYEGCRTLHRTPKANLRFLTVEEAERLGYQPCKVCH